MDQMDRVAVILTGIPSARPAQMFADGLSGAGSSAAASTVREFRQLLLLPLLCEEVDGCRRAEGLGKNHNSVHGAACSTTENSRSMGRPGATRSAILPNLRRRGDFTKAATERVTGPAEMAPALSS